LKSDSKIVLTLIACYLVIGIYNYSGTQVFLTPFFLNYYIFTAVAIWFFASSIKSCKNLLLGTYLLGIFALSSTHQMTISSFVTFFKMYSYENIIIPPVISLIGVLTFFICLSIIEHQRLKQTNFSLINFFPTLILITAIASKLLNFGFWATISLSAYMLIFIISLRQEKFRNWPEFHTIGYQYVLFFVLQNIWFLTTL